METEDRALRPTGFDSFLGQDESKAVLRTMVDAARARGEAADHVLFSGGPGLGKTTLANIVAAEMGARLATVSCPSVRTKAELAGVLVGLRKGDVLFLDEIHSLHPRIAEVLYPAMEDYRLEVVTGEGVNSSALRIPLSPFTLIGATTREGMLPQPLRDRFGVSVQMRPYPVTELAVIASTAASKLGFSITPEAAEEVARRSRSTPRVVNRIVRRVRDTVQLQGRPSADGALVRAVCEVLGIDGAGLDPKSRDYLRVLRDGSGPVGLSSICSYIAEGKDTVEDAIEPFLMQIGFVERTPKGRVLTGRGRDHIAKEPT
jgi:Holliday junction DNA helicase RuvB